MSAPRELTVACKKCGTQQPFKAWQSLNVTLNAELKAPLLKGELTRLTCNACGWSGEVLYPMLYHDMTRRLMIWLWLDAGEPDTSGVPMEKMGHYTFRTVSSRNDLVEKILIFDGGLDDRVMEFLKLMLWAQAIEKGQPYKGGLLFAKAGPAEGGEALQFIVRNQSPTDRVTVAMDSYHKLTKTLADKLDTVPGERQKWLRVDQEYARALANRTAQSS